jgi:hypothetical protein
MKISPVIGIYRRMLRLCRTITPEKKRLDALSSVRKQFKEHSEEKDSERVAELLAKANSSLGYLKMISPKTKSTTDGQTGRTRITYGDAGGSKGTVVSNWTGTNIDPDSRKRHYNQLSRAGFTNNESVKGPLF